MFRESLSLPVVPTESLLCSPATVLFVCVKGRGELGRLVCYPKNLPLIAILKIKEGGQWAVLCVCVCVCVFSVFSSPLLAILKSHFVNVFWLLIVGNLKELGAEMCVHGCVQLFVTLRTVAHQAPQSMGFSWQEHWSGLPFPPPRNHPNPGTEPGSSALAGRFFTMVPEKFTV